MIKYFLWFSGKIYANQLLIKVYNIVITRVVWQIKYTLYLLSNKVKRFHEDVARIIGTYIIFLSNSAWIMHVIYRGHGVGELCLVANKGASIAIRRYWQYSIPLQKIGFGGVTCEKSGPVWRRLIGNNNEFMTFEDKEIKITIMIRPHFYCRDSVPVRASGNGEDTTWWNAYDEFSINIYENRQTRETITSSHQEGCRCVPIPI